MAVEMDPSSPSEISRRVIRFAWRSEWLAAARVARPMTEEGKSTR